MKLYLVMKSIVFENSFNVVVMYSEKETMHSEKSR